MGKTWRMNLDGNNDGSKKHSRKAKLDFVLKYALRAKSKKEIRGIPDY